MKELNEMQAFLLGFSQAYNEKYRFSNTLKFLEGGNVDYLRKLVESQHAKYDTLFAEAKKFQQQVKEHAQTLQTINERLNKQEEIS